MLKRRTLLQTILMSPFFGASRSFAAMQPGTPTTSGYVNIVIHGLFFLELNNTNPATPLITISAPKISDHIFLAGTRRNLRPTGNINWSAGSGLQGRLPTLPASDTIPREVKSSILQFTKKETGVGNLKTDPNLYFGKVTLPWPYDFYSLRLDDFPPIDPSRPHVGPKVKGRCGGSKIGTATCLQYKYDFSEPVFPGSTPTTTFHLHLLSCDDEDVNHVNNALSEAANVFENSQFFDFQVGSFLNAIPLETNPPVLGVTPEDERSAKEDEPNWRQWCLQAKSQQVQRSKAGDKQSGGVVGIENLNPANCPLFFVG